MIKLPEVAPPLNSGVIMTKLENSVKRMHKSKKIIRKNFAYILNGLCKVGVPTS